jgi:hypothetical protein
MQIQKITMKKLSFVLIGIAAMFAAAAQGRSTVTLNVNGNRSYNTQISIDGRSYTLSNTNNNTIGTLINDLTPGQHSLQIMRSRANARQNDVSTTFTLRNRYDMRINVNDDGSLELMESMRFRNNYDNNTNARINAIEFNNLYRNIRLQRTPEQRRVMVANAFSGAGNRYSYFSSAQVAQLLQLVASDGDRIQLAKQAYPRVYDPANYSKVELQFNDVNRDELNTYVYGYNNDDVVDNSNSGVVINAAITDASYNTLYNRVRSEWPASTQYNSLYSTFSNSNNYFTTTQAMQLIQLTNSEANRLTLAKMSYRGIVDPGNFTQMYNLFNTQSNRNELAAYVNSYRPGTVYTTYHTAMSDYEFNRTIQDVRSRFLPFEKMTTLTNIFNTSTNYFTSDQAKQLIGLVSSEDNRLQLSKSAYARIVDKTNFRTVYDLLDRQASRDELSAYVNAYVE